MQIGDGVDRRLRLPIPIVHIDCTRVFRRASQQWHRGASPMDPAYSFGDTDGHFLPKFDDPIHRARDQKVRKRRDRNERQLILVHQRL